MNKKDRQQIKYCDILFWSCMIMFMLIRVFSLALFSSIQTESKAEIESVVTAYEANPIAKIIINLGKIGYIIQFVIFPAILFAMYMSFRSKAKKDRSYVESLVYMMNFSFFMCLMNICNDGAILLGKLI